MCCKLSVWAFYPITHSPLTPCPPSQFLWWVINVLSSHVLAFCEDVILFDDQVSCCNECVGVGLCVYGCVCNTNVIPWASPGGVVDGKRMKSAITNLSCNMIHLSTGCWRSFMLQFFSPVYKGQYCPCITIFKALVLSQTAPSSHPFLSLLDSEPLRLLSLIPGVPSHFLLFSPSLHRKLLACSNLRMKSPTASWTPSGPNGSRSFVVPAALAATVWF